MSQFIPFEPFAPRGASWRPLGHAATLSERPWTTGISRPPPVASRRDVDRAPIPEPEPDDVFAVPEELAEPEPPLLPEPDLREEARVAEHAAALVALDAQRAAMRAETERLEAATATLEAAGRALEAAHVSLVAEVRTGAAAVILAAARRIAGDALHADPALLAALVDEAAGCLGRESLVVHVSPLDADTLRERLPGIEVVEDFGIEAGCVCVGPAGRLDASLESATVAVSAVIERWRLDE